MVWGDYYHHPSPHLSFVQKKDSRFILLRYELGSLLVWLRGSDRSVDSSLKTSSMAKTDKESEHEVVQSGYFGVP